VGCARRLLLLLGRVLRPLIVHTRLGFLSAVIQRVLSNLAPFLWVFVPVYLVFAALAHLLFGAYMSDFSSFSGSTQALFNMLLGQTDWSALRGPAALYGAGMEFVATAYFWTFYIATFYILVR
jgi:hypothetical protein